MIDRDTEIAEPDVQRAILAAMHRSAALRDGLLQKAGRFARGDRDGFTYQGGVRSVVEGRSETDIQADWRHMNGQRLRFLIEVKLAAQFMPRQGSRYLERVQSALARGDAEHVQSILLAPASYFGGANPEMHKFNIHMSLEELVQLAKAQAGGETALINEALERIATGRPLGAKGLYRNLHDALFAEFEASGSMLTITNRATDWVFVAHPSFEKGVRARYRISEGLVELRISKHFRLPHSELPVPGLADCRRVLAGTETLYKLQHLRVSNGARANTPTDEDVALITSSLLRLVKWWNLCQGAV